MNHGTSSQALSGLTVIDCTRGTAGVRATGLLADYGATVVWVEQPGGDPYRQELAVDYAVFNRGKKSITLDLKSADDAATMRDLLARADVFVESWRPGVAERLGLGWEAVHALNPSLVYTSISAFGTEGRFANVPGYESLVHALSGSMAEQPGHRPGPVYSAFPFASIGAAYLSVLGTLACLIRRRTDGMGRRVETSLYDGAVSYMMSWGWNSKTDTKRATARGNRKAIIRNLLCADGRYIGVHTGAVGAFNRLVAVLGLDDQLHPNADGLDLTRFASSEEEYVLNHVVPGMFESKSSEQWVKELLEADVCVMDALEAGEVFDGPQVRHNNMVVTVDDPELGPLEQVAPALRFRDIPLVSPTPAPRVNENEAEVRDFIAAASVKAAESDGSHEDTPLLAGLRVLDLGAYYAGPFSSRLLADLGATVIKLEPLRGDPLRGNVNVFNSGQAGKRAIAADLKTEGGKEIVRRLIESVDIVHHNMRPGAADRLGISFEQVSVLKPDIIYLYAPGWGSRGPWAQRQSFAPLLSDYVGLGFEVAGAYNPPLFSTANEDTGNGYVGAIGMLLAILRRGASEVGAQFIENPQLNAAMYHVAHHVRTPDGTTLNAGKLDTLQMRISATDGLYETSDGFMCVYVSRDDDFAKLAQAVGIDLDRDSAFATAAGRSENDYALTQTLAGWFEERSTEQVMETLTAVKVPNAAPVEANNVPFMMDPANVASRRVAVVSTPDLGEVREFDQLMRVTDARLKPHRVAPRLAQHTVEILRELGYGDTDIASFIQQSAVRVEGTTPSTKQSTTRESDSS